MPRALVWTLGLSLGLFLELSGCGASAPAPVKLPPVQKTTAIDATLASFDGTPVRYHVEGSGRPALVFVHGWAGDRTHWNATVSHFASHHQVVTLDLPGHGESGRGRRDWPIAAFGRDVAKVVDALGLEKVILVGHSMGGAVILEAARLLPGKVIGVVGVDTFHNVERKMDPQQAEALLGRWRADYEKTAHEFAGFLLPANADPGLKERITGAMLQMPPEIGVTLLEHLFAYDLAAAFDQTKVPIRAINSTSPTDVEGNRRHSPGFAAVALTGIGHYPMLEAPELFDQKLAEIVAAWTGSSIAGS